MQVSKLCVFASGVSGGDGGDDDVAVLSTEEALLLCGRRLPISV